MCMFDEWERVKDNWKEGDSTEPIAVSSAIDPEQYTSYAMRFSELLRTHRIYGPQIWAGELKKAAISKPIIQVQETGWNIHKPDQDV